MSEMVDARGLPCPQPVILTKKALAEVDEVTAIVDNETAKMNVSRMAAKEGCRVEVEKKADGIYLHLTKTGKAPREEPVAPGRWADRALRLRLGRGSGNGGAARHPHP